MPRPLTDDEIRRIAADPRTPTHLRDWADDELKTRTDKSDSKRLAKLVDALADHVLTRYPGERIEFGLGINRTVVTADDLERIAELLDPTINQDDQEDQK